MGEELDEGVLQLPVFSLKVHDCFHTRLFLNQSLAFWSRPQSGGGTTSGHGSRKDGPSISMSRRGLLRESGPSSWMASHCHHRGDP